MENIPKSFFNSPKRNITYINSFFQSLISSIKGKNSDSARGLTDHCFMNKSMLSSIPGRNDNSIPKKKPLYQLDKKTLI